MKKGGGGSEKRRIADGIQWLGPKAGPQPFAIEIEGLGPVHRGSPVHRSKIGGNTVWPPRTVQMPENP